MMFLKETDHLLVPGGPEAFDPNITIFKAMPGTCIILVILLHSIILLVRKCPPWRLPPDWLTVSQLLQSFSNQVIYQVLKHFCLCELGRKIILYI